jgi:hypothetical protein
MTEISKTGNLEIDSNSRYRKSAHMVCLTNLIRAMDNVHEVNNCKSDQPTESGNFSHTDSYFQQGG